MPSGAVAAPGENEYGVNIPTGDGGGQDPTANASGGSSDTSSGTVPDDTVTTTPTTDTAVTDDSSDGSDKGGAAGGGGKGGDGGGDKALSGNGGDRHQDSLAPTGESSGAVQSSDSDDGGFPVILVAIAVLAAAGVGFAAWRLRRGGDGVGHPAQSGHSA